MSVHPNEGEVETTEVTYRTKTAITKEFHVTNNTAKPVDVEVPFREKSLGVMAGGVDLREDAGGAEFSPMTDPGEGRAEGEVHSRPNDASRIAAFWAPGARNRQGWLCTIRNLKPGKTVRIVYTTFKGTMAEAVKSFRGMTACTACKLTIYASLLALVAKLFAAKGATLATGALLSTALPEQRIKGWIATICDVLKIERPSETEESLWVKAFRKAVEGMVDLQRAAGYATEALAESLCDMFGVCGRKRLQ